MLNHVSSAAWASSRRRAASHSLHALHMGTPCTLLTVARTVVDTAPVERLLVARLPHKEEGAPISQAQLAQGPVATLTLCAKAHRAPCTCTGRCSPF